MHERKSTIHHLSSPAKALLALSGALLSEALLGTPLSQATTCPTSSVQFLEYEFVRETNAAGVSTDSNPTDIPSPLILRAGEHEPGSVLVDNWLEDVLVMVPESE